MNNDLDNILSPTRYSANPPNKRKYFLSLGRAEQLNQTLFKISNTVRISSDFGDLCESIHHILGEIMDLTNFFIALYHKENERISFPYFRDIYDAEEVYCDELQLDNCLTGGVIQNATPVFLRKNELEKRRDSKTLIGTVPELWLGVPLKIKDEVIGVMATLSYHDAELFDETDLNTLISVSDQIALAIERKQYEQALISSEKKYRNILETMVEGYFEQDHEGKITMANPAMCKMLDKPIEKVIGTSFKEFLVNVETNSINDGFQDLFNSQKTTLNIHFELILSNNSIRYLEGTLSPILNDNNAVTGIKGIVRDITEKEKAEQKRKKVEKKQQQSQRLESLGTLAGGVAHDFNNILGAILGYAEMVQDDCPPASRMRKDIDHVIEASHRAKELVKQILAFSRQTEGDVQVLKPDLIIKEAIKMLRASLPATIDIQQNIDSEAGPILADPTQIHQILTNLCTNAFHAMGETGGTLKISLKNKKVTLADLVSEEYVQPGHFVDISVGDTGPGIAPQIIDKIFDPFFTTKEVGKGTGMGLAIIHGIAKKSGGFISCNSSSDEGTIFHVYLPVHEPTGQPEGEITPLELIQTGIERILFIDDEEMLAELGKAMLERLGYRVTAETNSIEAMKIIQNQPDGFDLVITDQTMPGMTGSDLARRILQIRPGLPIILCTGFSNMISEEKARMYGIKGFVMKPVTQKDLATLIRKVLNEEK